MRLKVESVPPLPHVKAWFSAQALPSVLDLKTALCTDLAPFKHAAIVPEHLVLLLDDFELLDSSPIHVLRDGDLIVIKKTVASLQHKRKTPPTDVSSPAKKRTKTEETRRSSRAPPTPIPSTSRSKRQVSLPISDSSSDSSTESDTSDSSSSSSSDSDSDSDSSSSSSSTSSASSASSAPSVKPSRQNGTNAHPMPHAHKVGPKKSIDPPPAVPPGLGKPSTHSRNLRRRRKKMYERLAQTAEPASVNEIPLGTRARTFEPADVARPTPPSPSPPPSTGKGKGKAPARDHADTAETPLFMMASLQNKNKRRGFKDALSRGVPSKIVFSSESPDGVGTSASSPGQADGDPDAMTVEASLQVPVPAQDTQAPRMQQQQHQPRLVPPSEKQELGQIPANMFVTSVDVEEGMWPSARKNRTKKKKAQAEEVREQEEEVFPDGLPYDDDAAACVAAPKRDAAKPAGAEAVEHGAVAAQWYTLRKITDKSQVSVGGTVAWKVCRMFLLALYHYDRHAEREHHWQALGINFATLTPEMLLHVGRVLQCDEQLIVVEPITEVAAPVSFGGPVAEDEPEGGAVEETFAWTDVLQGDWRLVSTG
ncbi:hypothetical protein C8Q76DRAFT_803647 [Earliella scabrosa]|nr:hypothetical protein C8Q76DRAFT_803647 [Earliella scabrosa]